MLLSYLLLAFSVSIDSLGIGITYGIKQTSITNVSKFILCIISFITVILSIWVGNAIKNIFSAEIASLIGSLILVCMGIFMLWQALGNKKDEAENITIEKEEKIYSFFIKFLGITIQIIKNPISSDFDKSKRIDSLEAFYLGIAMSLDAFCVGIGGSIIGFSSIIFPILVSIFQLIFLSFGSLIGKTISNNIHMPNNIWNIISGLLLIVIAVIKIII